MSYEHLVVAKGPKAPSFAWKMVTCHRCRTEYRCTPNTDYFSPIPNTVPKDDESGFCWDCLLIVQGVTSKRVEAGKSPQPEPQLGDSLFQGPYLQKP